MTEEQKKKLQTKLPDWAIKQHPTKTNLSVIHPMAVIDRLNEVFGIGQWNFTTEFISCDKEVQQTKNGERNVYVSAVKGKLEVPEEGILLEQYGGSTNDDKGDALKGGGTDSLTKIASYLGIGAEIYKGKGNISGGEEPAKLNPKEAYKRAFQALTETDTLEALNAVHMQIRKSKIITDDDKQDLHYQYQELAEKYDPTK